MKKQKQTIKLVIKQAQKITLITNFYFDKKTLKNSWQSIKIYSIIQIVHRQKGNKKYIEK